MFNILSLFTTIDLFVKPHTSLFIVISLPPQLKLFVCKSHITCDNYGCRFAEGYMTVKGSCILKGDKIRIRFFCDS